MDTLTQSPDRALYDADEHAWLLRQIAALRDGRLRDIDRDTLADYLTDMTIRDRRELKSRFAVLLQHLLKLQFQPERQSRSWVLTVQHQQAEIADILQSSPSLAADSPALFEEAYPRAVRFAATETGLAVAEFPQTSPWTLAEALAVVPRARPLRVSARRLRS